MKTITRFSLLLVIIVTAMPALAVDPEPKSPITTPESGITEAKGATNPQDPAKVQEDLSTASPMMSEIRVAMEISRGEISELAATAAATNDFSARQAIQISISEIKQQTELDVLAIQARYARSSGNEELAQQIDAAIAAITSPPAVIAPAEARPAPANQN